MVSKWDYVFLCPLPYQGHFRQDLETRLLITTLESGGATSIQGVETRDATQPLTVHREAPHNKEGRWCGLENTALKYPHCPTSSQPAFPPFFPVTCS